MNENQTGCQIEPIKTSVFYLYNYKLKVLFCKERQSCTIQCVSLFVMITSGIFETERGQAKLSWEQSSWTTIQDQLIDGAKSELDERAKQAIASYSGITVKNFCLCGCCYRDSNQTHG